jgi:hypothetical protein
MQDDEFLKGMLGIMGPAPVLFDRGYDRGEYRFGVVLPAGSVTRGETVQTDRGAFDVRHIGRPYRGPDGADVTNVYLDVTPADIGAVEDELTPEQVAYREARKQKQTAGFERWRAGLAPGELSRMGKAAFDKYRESTTYAERNERQRAGVAEFWRIMRADPTTLTPAELKRRTKAEARRKRTPEQRARIAAATREGIAKRKTRAVVTPEQTAAAAEYLARHMQGTKT